MAPLRVERCLAVSLLALVSRVRRRSRVEASEGTLRLLPTRRTSRRNRPVMIHRCLLSTRSGCLSRCAATCRPQRGAGGLFGANGFRYLRHALHLLTLYTACAQIRYKRIEKSRLEWNRIGLSGRCALEGGPTRPRPYQRCRGRGRSSAWPRWCGRRPRPAPSPASRRPGGSRRATRRRRSACP